MILSSKFNQRDSEGYRRVMTGRSRHGVLAMVRQQPGGVHAPTAVTLLLTAQVLAFAVLIGAVALPGAFLAKAFVERMPLHIHTAILDAVVIAGGAVMIFAAARA
jgi:hypothetical protein